MELQVFSANEWVYLDSTVEPHGPRAVSLVAARGGRAACQIFFGSVKPEARIAWFFRSPSGLPVPEVFQMIDVQVDMNTGEKGPTWKEEDPGLDHVTRRAPFRVYDALKPLNDEGKSRAAVEALYVSWRIPRGMNPGRYTGALHVEIGRRKANIPVEIVIYAATVPEEETLRVTNWFSLGNMATKHGLEPWSEDHWEMIRRYARLMRRQRQTDFLLPRGFVEVKTDEVGRHTFNFDRMERLIRLFFDEGFSYLNGGHVAGHSHEQKEIFVLGVDGKATWAAGREGYRFLAEYLPAWREFLRSHGWLGKTIQHVADEPWDDSKEDYRVLAGIVRKFMPGVPVIDALGLPALGGSVDIWVPTNQTYEDRREEFEEHRALGDTLWFYTCCSPTGRYLNRFLDAPLLRTRYLHWGNYLYDLKGYLHWGLNQLRADQDAFECHNPLHGHNDHFNLPAGDSHIVYPGEGEPWSSVRFEAMGMGIEDYELLRLLAEKDKTHADAICTSVMRSFHDVDKTPAAFDQAHVRLLDALSTRKPAAGRKS